MKFQEGKNKLEELNEKVLEQIQVGEVSVGMTDFQNGDTLTDDEFDKVLAMMNKGAQQKGYSDVKEQVKTITEQSKKLDPFAEMHITTKTNQNLMNYLNAEREHPEEFD